MISVIIPAYNEENRIAQALEALLAQTAKNVEIIVVDNNSTDITAKIVSTFPVTLISENRKGTMWACEAGRQKATGDIIVRMDADCVPYPDWLEKGTAHFRDLGVVAVTGPYRYYDGSSILRIVALAFQNMAYPPVNFMIRKSNMGGILIGGNSFMRATALEKMGGFNTTIIFHGDDTDVAKRISRYGRIVFDTDLPINTSARRFQSEGFIMLCVKYFLHFIKVLVVGGGS